MPDYLVLMAAFALDIFIGDPLCIPHPVRWMGQTISWLEVLFRRLRCNAKISGAIFAVLLITGTWSLTWLLLLLIKSLLPQQGAFIVNVILLFFTISCSSLHKAAMEVMRPLEMDQRNKARKRLSMIVGRDTQTLSIPQMVRAAVETVSENLVDGVISPVFFFAIGGVPMAAAYKMINTLDSMIGYKNETYKDFGMAAARIDDIANYIPARLSVCVIALASKLMTNRFLKPLTCGISQGRRHISPNSGYPEAAFAGALGVRLGGPARYKGKLVSKPYIGIEFNDATILDIVKACDLMTLSAAIWTLLVALFLL